MRYLEIDEEYLSQWSGIRAKYEERDNLKMIGLQDDLEVMAVALVEAGRLLHIEVKEHHRRSGYATKLLRSVAERNPGIAHPMRAVVCKSNLGAVSALIHAGFVFAGFNVTDGPNSYLMEYAGPSLLPEQFYPRLSEDMSDVLNKMYVTEVAPVRYVK